VPSQSSQKTIPGGKLELLLALPLDELLNNEPPDKLELLLAPPLGELLNGESPEEELSVCPEISSSGFVSDEQENSKPIAITETAKTKTLFINNPFFILSSLLLILYYKL
jgi:hypothetical protein